MVKKNAIVRLVETKPKSQVFYYYRYRHHMPLTLEGQITIEKSPSYFVTKEAARRVQHMNPSTKLLVVVRDPVTRAISDYTQAVSKKPEMALFERLAFTNNTTSGSHVVDNSWGPIKLGLYSRYLVHWLRCFPLSQVPAYVPIIIARMTAKQHCYIYFTKWIVY